MKKKILFVLYLIMLSLIVSKAQVPESVNAVDLGLPSGTLWANMNLGSNTVAEYGKYFSWGETNKEERINFYKDKDPLYKIVKNSYIDADGFTVTETKEGYSKYVLEVDADKYGYDGLFDNKVVLDKEDDAAFVIWGDKWKIPTIEQWRELESECTWQAVTLNDINGYKVIGNNNNYIFIPKGGNCYEEWQYQHKGEYTCYWSSSLSNTSIEALGHVNTGDPNTGVVGTRYMGRLIRPVYSDQGNIGKEKCQKPTISYNKGKLKFFSTTDGVNYHYSISNQDVRNGSGTEVELSVMYTISVYAVKSNYDNSDVATATLCWIDVEPQKEGITDGVFNVPAQALLIQSNGGQLSIQGVDDGKQIRVYSINGTEAGKAISKNGCASVNTNLQAGSMAIIKIGEKSVKVVVK